MPITKINSLGVNLSSPLTFSAGTVSLPSITFSGDTNTGVFAPASDTVAFTEGGAEAMRIDSAGDVGIGTSDPITKLHINTSSSGSNVNLLSLVNPNSADNTATSIIFAPETNK